MKNIRYIFILLFGALSVYSCSKSGPEEPDGPGGEDPGGQKSASCTLQSIRIDGGRNGIGTNISFSLAEITRTATATLTQWIAKTDPEYLIPTFTHSGDHVLVNGERVVSNVTKISFAEDISFVVVAENGDTKTYTISLICPQINTELPVLRLQPESAINSKETYVKTVLDMYSAVTPSGWWSAADGKIEVRGRGNSTWGDADKKPYRLKFPAKYSPLGLDHAYDRNWVILANDSDKSFMRNEMGFAFSRVLFNASDGYHDPNAILFTPCSQFVNVYMGNSYIGIYQLSDHMHRSEGRIAVEKLTAADGSSPSLITGGHILETDIHGNNSPERFNSRTRNIQINHKYPDSDDYDPAQYRYIENFINEMENVLYGNNFTDPVNGWRRYLDEKTLADFIIMKEFAGDADGYTSTYMYKRRGVDRIFFGPGWDFDKGCDNEWRVDGSDPVNNLMINVGFGMPGRNGTDWFQRLWQDDSFRATVKARWTSKKGQLKDEAMRVLNEKPAAMSKSVKANFTVCPWWDYNYPERSDYGQARRIWGSKEPAATYELEIERIRTYINNRANALDRLFR